MHKNFVKIGRVVTKIMIVDRQTRRHVCTNVRSAGADPENELGGGQFRGSPAEGWRPGRGSGDEVPQKLTTFRS